MNQQNNDDFIPLVLKQYIDHTQNLVKVNEATFQLCMMQHQQLQNHLQELPKLINSILLQDKDDTKKCESQRRQTLKNLPKDKNYKSGTEETTSQEK